MTLPISCWAMEQHQEEEEECASQIITASGSASASGVSGSDLDLESFSPKGLRVLVVDEDPISLSLIERMLTQCEYVVTTCRSVSQAISLIMDTAEGFNIVLCDVHLPGEDGFRLLDIFGSSPELPVVMMSVNGYTSTVMTGIMKGACDFLIKPVRMEELRNIWQHIVRKQLRRNGKATTTRNSNNSNDDNSSKCNNSNSNSNKCNSRGSEKAFRSADSVESICSLRIMNSSSNKRKSYDCNTIPTIESQLQLQTQQQHHHMIQDITGLKKARVHWTGQLHHQFVKAVNQLGLDRAVPKRILEIMNVQGLTRENVASHLQKYRLHLKRMSGRMPEPCPVASFQAARDGKSGGKLQIRPRHPHPHQRQPRKTAPATLIPAPPAENSLGVSSTGEAKIVTRQLQQSSTAVGVNEEEVELLDNMAEQCGLPLPCDEDFKSATVAEISLADYFLGVGDFLPHHHHSTPPQQLC